MEDQSEIDKLRQAIAALQAQRQTLGDAIVDTALAPLRARLAELHAAALGEQRRMVTVLFADLVGSTTLFSHLDSEDVRELTNRYFAIWKACIDRHGGVVEKFIGDAVMAVFGLQAAKEDDAEQAIRCALEMRQLLDELNQDIEREWRMRLQMRVGINTGEVVVSAIDENRGNDFVVVGEAVNLTSRLQGAAPAGGILIAHATYRLVQGIFTVRKLDPVLVKGVRAPVQVYLVIAAKSKAFRMETRGVDGIETRMIGRDGDLTRLQALFLEAVEDRVSRVITITGDPGIGKSRLIYEFSSWLELLPEIVFYFKGRAYESTHSFPYSLLRSVIALRFEIQDSDTPDTVWEKLRQGVGEVLGNAEMGARKAYFIGRLLGFEVGESSPAGESLDDARQFHDQALSYLSEYFRGMALKNPVVVLLEDIHWADNSSLDLIHSLEGSLAEQPLLIVCTARPVLYEKRPNWGEGLLFHSRMDLFPLTKPESRQLVNQILQKVENIPDELRELLVERAEGNPFFIEEGIKVLMEDGVIEKASDRWRIHTEKLTDIKIPHTLVGVLQARLDSLDHRQRLLLQRASVVGRVFWDQAVDFLDFRETPVGGKQTVQAREVLRELRAREIVFHRERSSFDDTHEYLFKHALLRDVTYESLLKRQRRIYHARAAHWLEQVTQRSYRTDEYAALIALHYEQAGEREAARNWYERAGKQAAARFANTEAVQAFSRALELTPSEDLHAHYDLVLRRESILDRLGERQNQVHDLELLTELAEKTGSDAVLAEVALRKANFAFTTGDYPGAVSAARQATELARQAGSIDKEAESFYSWGRALDFQRAGPEGFEKLEQALELARKAQLPKLEAEILQSIGSHFSDLSQFEEARKYLLAALQIYRRFGDQHGEGRALGNLGVTYWGQGNPAEAKSHFEAALQLMRETGDRRVEGILVGNLGVIAAEQLDYEESRRYHMDALKINREIQNKHSELINIGNLAEIERDLGLFEDAQVHYEQAYKLSVDLDTPQNLSAILQSWSLLQEYLGDHRQALGKAQEAIKLAQQVNSALYESGALFRLGQALLAAGQCEEAELPLMRSLDLKRKLSLENQAMEVLAGLARVRQACGEPLTALTIVDEILEYLESHTLVGLEEPVRVYLTCCQILDANDDPRAPYFMEEAYQFLQNLAAMISDEQLRKTFLELIPWNRRLIELWGESQA